MRIGLLYPTPDALSPANWSGTPAGLAGGLEQNGVEVIPVSAKLAPGVHQWVAFASRAGGQRGAVADRMPVRQRTRTRALAAAIRKVGKLDAVVAMGTEMYDLDEVLPKGLRCLTYDDGTLAQMWRHPDSDIRESDFPSAHVDEWIRRQKASSRRADTCCVSTQWAAGSFTEDYGVPKENVRVVGMGHRPRPLSEAGRVWSSPRFLFVGVDWQRKNGEAVLAAFRSVRRSFPKATLDIVGRAPAIHEPGVRVHGFLPREQFSAQKILDGLYENATCFVLPSLFDPSPISYLEAGSAGLPVIATGVGGAGELLGAGAVIVDPKKEEQIIAAMLELADPERAREMGAAASRQARRASWGRVGGRIVHVVEGLNAADNTDDAAAEESDAAAFTSFGKGER